MKIITDSEHDEIVSSMNSANSAIKELKNDYMQLDMMYKNLSIKYKELAKERDFYKDEIIILLNKITDEKTNN